MKFFGLLVVGNSVSVWVSGGVSLKFICFGGGIVFGIRREMICYVKIEDV